MMMTAYLFLIGPLAGPIVFGLAKTTFIMTIVMTSGLLLSWVERKQSAIMQDRIGANRASILGISALGLVNNLADALKGITKEDYIPPKANKLLHTLAPFMACFTATAAFAVLPFGGEIRLPHLDRAIPLVIAPMSPSLLFVFAMLGMGVYGVFLAGYVSGNKYGTLGALRASAQMISYEVATGLTLLGALMMYQSLDFRAMVQWQQDNAWGIVYQPVGFILFMTATIVEMKRVPFDLPEAESEIIGYSVEYSGMKFMLFLMAEFIETLLFSWIIVLIFLGGWHLPGLRIAADGSGAHWYALALGYWQAVGIETLAFVLKVVFLCWLSMLIRWSLPRFRYDQIMHLGWKIMLPIALGNVMLTALFILFFPGH
jgi:NADH-quinone oxidoreductase subunit H